MRGYPKGMGMVLMLVGGVLLGACGEGAVSDLLGTESLEPNKFENVDEGTKAKFTKIESIKPNEILTLKVELFSFLSNDPLSLTNLSPLSFVPSEIGVEDAPEGELRYPNGFVSRVKLLNPLSCGKFILTDLKIILCPGSMNVAFTSSQDPKVSIGISLESMFEVSSGAKESEEFSELEEEVSVALSDDLDKSEQASDAVANQSEAMPASSPVSSTFVLGKKPQSHVTTEVSIVGGANDYSAQVAFAKDYILLIYGENANATKKIRIYNKDFSQGFSLLKEYSFVRSFGSVNAIGTSSDGKRIFIAGRDRKDIETSDVVLYEVGYDKASNTFGSEKYEIISNDLLADFNRDPLAGVIHPYSLEGNTSAVRYVGVGRSSGGQTRLFAMTGAIGSGSVNTVVGVNINPGDSIRTFVWAVLYKNFAPTSYLIEYRTAEPPEYIRQALVKVGPAPFEIQKDYGPPSILDSVFTPEGGGSFVGGYYLDGVDILATYASSMPDAPPKFVVIRVEPSKGIAWDYSVSVDSEFGFLGSDYDVMDTGNAVLIQSGGSISNRVLKLKGIRLTY